MAYKTQEKGLDWRFQTFWVNTVAGIRTYFYSYSVKYVVIQALAKKGPVPPLRMSKSLSNLSVCEFGGECFGQKRLPDFFLVQNDS